MWGLTTSNNTCWRSIKNPYMPMKGHIRKSTVSELYEFFGVCPHLLSLATVAFWNALFLKLGWHAFLRS